MATKEQKEIKKQEGLIKNILNKCKYSLNGLAYCFEHESSFLLEAIAACFIIVLGICFDITFLEWVITFGSLAMVSIIELINTAIEATVDMVTLEYNEFAKVAKDCGSAATALMSVLAIVANLIIFVPYFLEFILKFI